MDMAAVEDDILTEFYRRLEASAEITSSMLDVLRSLLSSDAKLKADDFARIFAPPSEEEIP